MLRTALEALVHSGEEITVGALLLALVGFAGYAVSGGRSG